MTRETRNDATQAERKRRKGSTLDRTAGMKLAIPPEFQDDKDHHYFWANDTGSRVYDLTHHDDYDVVTRSGVSDNEDDRVRRPVGTDEGGHPIYAQLLRKPMELVHEDNRARDDERKAMERSMVTKPKDSGKGGDSSTTYVVDGSQIKHGGYTP